MKKTLTGKVIKQLWWWWWWRWWWWGGGQGGGGGSQFGLNMASSHCLSMALAGFGKCSVFLLSQLLSKDSFLWLSQCTVCPGLQSCLLWGTWARCCWHFLVVIAVAPGVALISDIKLPGYLLDIAPAPLGFLASARHCATVHLCM